MKDRIKGKFEEAKGKLTGDRPEELKGKARQKVGEVKETAGDLRDRAERHDPRRPDDGLLDDHGQPRRDDGELLDDHRDVTTE